MTTSPDRVVQSLRRLASAAQALEANAADVVRIAGRYAKVLGDGGTVFFAGNGGSAAHAQHIATEYSVRYRRDRRALRAVALTADGSALTAAANDLGFEAVFARQLEALARPGDLLVLLSTSGKSPNLLRAASAARRLEVGTVAMLGGDGGPLRSLVDDALVVPSADTSRVQELQLAIEHVIVELVEEALGV